MSSPSPHHRHQSSLEGVIDFDPSPQLLNREQSRQARQTFSQIISFHEPLQTENGSYKRITLIRLTYEYARSETSQDNFLRYFFQYTAVTIERDIHFDDWDQEQKNAHESNLNTFADFLVDNFFLPRETTFMCQPESSLTLSSL